MPEQVLLYSGGYNQPFSATGSNSSSKSASSPERQVKRNPRQDGKDQGDQKKVDQPTEWVNSLIIEESQKQRNSVCV